MMKTKITTLIAFIAISLTISAQKGAVNAADYELTLESPDLDRAEAKILEAEKNEKTINYARTYLVKAKVYRAKAKKKDETFDSKALFTSYDAIQKAEELDQKGDAKGKGVGKYKEDIKSFLVFLKMDLQNCGAGAYNSKDYALAMQCFEKVLAVGSMESNKVEGQEAVIDTSILFNTAICAYYSDDTVKTKEYMAQCLELGYGDATPYQIMYVIYREEQDTANMVNTLIRGFNDYPEEPMFLKELVIYYINSKNLEEGMKYINIALDKDPNNSAYWFTKGTFFDQSGDKEEALAAYKKALSTAVSEDDKYNANYNLAVMAYNEAVEASNQANDEVDMKLSKKKTEAAKAKFRECLPYFESCLEIKGDDLETLKALRPVYYRLSDDPAMMKKYEALQEKIKILEGE